MFANFKRKMIRRLKFYFGKPTLTDKEIVEVQTVLKLSRFDINQINTGKFYPQKVPLFDAEFEYTDGFWFLHSIRELFVEQVYKFSSSNATPLIIDCGSNIGLSVLFFKKLFPSSRIIAFEADPEVFKVCKRNIEAYKLLDVSLFNQAVWTSHQTLHFSATSALGGKVTNSPEAKIAVQGIDLYEYLDQPVDFLKMDIEGAEVAVLERCADRLKNVQKLFVEYHSACDDSQQLSKLLGIFSAAGFRYYIRNAWENLTEPFVDYKPDGGVYDSQLNIFCYRVNMPQAF